MSDKEFELFLAELKLDALSSAKPLAVSVGRIDDDDDAELAEYVGLLELAASLR